MTFQQVAAATIIYALALAAVVYFTRPRWRRFAGAMAGGVVVACVGFGAVIPAGEALRVWHVPLESSPKFMGLLLIAAALSAVPILLITWRIARRFGPPGLIAVGVALAVIGPPREFAVAARFPEWITYAPGIATVFAIMAVYVGGVGTGHGIMRIVAGPARKDPLARWPSESVN